MLRHEKFAQWTFALFNTDEEICCYVLDLIQEYQTFFLSNKQKILLTIINI